MRINKRTQRIVAGTLALLGLGLGAYSMPAQAAKTYVIATSADFPPLSFRSPKDPAKIVGFEMDMIKSIAKHAGWKYKIVTSDFSGLIPAVQSGRVDMVVSDVYHTEARQKIVDFVDYLKNGFGIMVSAANAGKIKSYADLCGMDVGVLTGSAPELQAVQAASEANCTSKGKPAIKPRSYPAVAQELPQLENGRLGGIFESVSTLGYVETQNPGKFHIAVIDPDTTNAGIVLKKGSPLVAEVQKQMHWYLGSAAAKADAKRWGLPVSTLLAP